MRPPSIHPHEHTNPRMHWAPETTAGSSWHISDLRFHQKVDQVGHFSWVGIVGGFSLRLGVWECGVLFSPSTKRSFPTHRQTWKESPFSNTLLNSGKSPICKKKKSVLGFLFAFVLRKPAIKYHPEYANHFCHMCLLKHCLFHHEVWLVRTGYWDSQHWNSESNSCQMGTRHSACLPFGDYQLKTVMMTQKRIVMQSKHSISPNAPLIYHLKGRGAY